MGTYGVTLFEDDNAQDVREEFLELLRLDYGAEESSEFLVERWATVLDDPDEAPVFWLALAATQCEYGCLQGNVRDAAIAVIDGETGLELWEGELREQRRQVLAHWRSKLLGPQPGARRPEPREPEPPIPRHEAPAPDGRGKAVAFGVPDGGFMQVYLEREVNGGRGGGSVFVACCTHDQVDLAWMPGPSLAITFPAGIGVRQQSSQHFFSGEVIPIVYQTK